jgi:ribosomal-protein-alanine N-acetyltransferase
VKWTIPKLQTNRLVLSPVSQYDVNSIYQYAKDPRVSRYTLWEPHQSLNDTAIFINDYVNSKYAANIPEPFGIKLKDGNEVIGTVGMFPIGNTYRAPLYTMELAYALNPEYWGQGIIIEAAQRVIEYCFNIFPMQRLQCRCKIENVASARVMEKLGMHFEGTLRSDIFHRQRFWDMHYYSLLKKDWIQQYKPIIRPAVLGDEEGIHLSHMQSIKENCSAFYRPDQIAAWSGRKMNINSLSQLILNHKVWVIEVKNCILGHGILFLNQEKKEAEIGSLYLNTEVIHQGLGKKLLSYMKDVALIHHMNCMTLSSTKNALNFYLSQGFKADGDEDRCLINGVEIEGYPLIINF